MVAVTNRCRASRLAGAPRSSAARSTPGRHAEVSTVGKREHGEQRERRVDRHEQRHGHAEPQDPAARREQRHVHVVEHEHLVAQHRQPVQVLGALVVLDGRDRRLKPGHVRFERDGQAVAKPALGAIAHDPQEPGRGRGRPEADRRGQHEPAVVRQHAVGQQLEPERQERVGQGRQQREPEGHDQEPRLGLVAPLRAPATWRAGRGGRSSREDIVAHPFLVSPPSEPKRDACRSNMVR